MFQHRKHLVHNLPRRALERLEQLRRRDALFARQTGLQVAALHRHDGFLCARIDAANRNFDLFGGVLPDHHAEVAADIFDHRVVKRVARDLDGRGYGDAVHAEDRDVGRAAADVDDHVARRPCDVQLGPQRCGERLFDQVHAPGPGLHRRLNDGALLHLGHAARHRDDHARLDEGEFADLFQKLLQHFLGHLIVGDDAVAQRPNSHGVARRAAQHIARRRADLQNLTGVLIHSDDRGFAQDNAPPLLIDQHVRRAEVDADVSRQFHDGSPFCSGFFLGVARAAQTTLCAPAVSSTRQHSESVEPVVTISSMSSSRLP